MSRLRQVVGTLTLASICLPVCLLHRFALRLDVWLYPSLHEVAISKPLFIVGLPRSGTTLLHRLMATQSGVFTTMPLWELLLAPAVCEKRTLRRLRNADRRLGSPLWRLYQAVERRLVGSFKNVHATTLFSPEEDYLSLLPFGGCFLDVIRAPRSERVWKLGHFCERLQRSQQMALLDVYTGILKRHLFFRGQHLRLLSKNPSFTSWIPVLTEAFPDACMVGLRRVPHESVPSQLSSLQSGMNWFGNDVTDSDIVARFVDLLAAYWRILKESKCTLRPDQFQLITYERLISESESVVRELMEQFGYEVTAAGLLSLQRQCSMQKRYSSRHRYRLETFGLHPDQLDRSFGLHSKSRCQAPASPGCTETLSC
ncbi:sulfotransferase [Rhodopirellula sp. JC740]|uniref:Sulfotransferase n=1 Tax=Rhodopirellula halodulae TaxID=2894198 RepID=A0ABS8NNV4_9BACT|nr:sulfotransferase [Rhodopirellula sp. JC740]MCC9645274.1 sulfotransferase [Rhodopirellula sp. JC740]